jgi:undecaprenyl-diphosphatase
MNHPATPHPRRYLFLSLVGTLLFAILATLVGTDSFVVGWDRSLSNGLHQFGVEHPSLQEFFVVVTDLGTGKPLYVVGALAVAVLLCRREWFRSVCWLAGLLACRPISPWLKDQFDRARPPFAFEMNPAPGFSFPSGHAFGSGVVYGMLALAMLRVWAGSKWKWLIAGAIWAFIGLVMLSRPLLGWHYPTDVLAGASLGLAWGFCWAAVADWWDLRRVRGSATAVEETQGP